PWGNRFRCHAPSPELGQTRFGIAYVEFSVPDGTANHIARFYREIMNASANAGVRDGSVTAWVGTGRDQYMFFRETGESMETYDGHTVQIYIADFSRPYRMLLERNLITRDLDRHEWRFRDI